ncbi:unnamed protein product [Lota lota]
MGRPRKGPTKLGQGSHFRLTNRLLLTDLPESTLPDACDKAGPKTQTLPQPSDQTAVLSVEQRDGAGDPSCQANMNTDMSPNEDEDGFGAELISWAAIAALSHSQRPHLDVRRGSAQVGCGPRDGVVSGLASRAPQSGITWTDKRSLTSALPALLEAGNGTQWSQIPIQHHAFMMDSLLSHSEDRTNTGLSLCFGGGAVEEGKTSGSAWRFVVAGGAFVFAREVAMTGPRHSPFIVPFIKADSRQNELSQILAVNLSKSSPSGDLEGLCTSLRSRSPLSIINRHSQSIRLSRKIYIERREGFGDSLLVT